MLIFASCSFLALAIWKVNAEFCCGPPPADAQLYADLNKWLCHPGMGKDNPCTKSLDTTLSFANGTTQVRSVQAAAEPAYDCFVLYPTISMEFAGNSDWKPKDKEEMWSVRHTFGQYAAGCRMFAPIYRSMTVPAMLSMIPADMVNISMSIDDALNAWDYYMTNLNQGRPYVLVGHSQGSMVLETVMAARIKRTTCQKQLLISAHLIGDWFATGVPPTYYLEDSAWSPQYLALLERFGPDVMSNPFSEADLCSSAEQVGCVVTFTTYSKTNPPSKWPVVIGNATCDNIGKGPPQLKLHCVNPAALLGETYSQGVWPFRSASGFEDFMLAMAGSTMQAPSWNKPCAVTPCAPYKTGTDTEKLNDQITTEFYEQPNYLKTSCKTDCNGKMQYLEVTLAKAEEDLRVLEGPMEFLSDDAQLAKEMTEKGQWVPLSGLHIEDVYVTLRSLVRLAEIQAKSWTEQGLKVEGTPCPASTIYGAMKDDEQVEDQGSNPEGSPTDGSQPSGVVFMVHAFIVMQLSRFMLTLTTFGCGP